MGEPPYESVFLIPGQFERNIYNDLLAAYGNDFVDHHRLSGCTVLSISIDTFSDVLPSTTSTGDPPDDAERFVECSCEIPYLAIGE